MALDFRYARLDEYPSISLFLHEFWDQNHVYCRERELFDWTFRTSNGMWIVNYVIRPDHRKGSAALQLLSQFRKPEFNPVIAFGINPATSAIYRVLRGQVLDEIPRHVMVLPESEERMAGLL